MRHLILYLYLLDFYSSMYIFLNDFIHFIIFFRNNFFLFLNILDYKFILVLISFKLLLVWFNLHITSLNIFVYIFNLMRNSSHILIWDFNILHFIYLRNFLKNFLNFLWKRSIMSNTPCDLVGRGDRVSQKLVFNLILVIQF